MSAKPNIPPPGSTDLTIKSRIVAVGMSIAAGIVVVSTAAGVTWAVFADHPSRPALKSEVDELGFEVDELAKQVAMNTRESLWVQLAQLERIRKRRPLTGRECRRYLAIAKQLGVPAKC